MKYRYIIDNKTSTSVYEQEVSSFVQWCDVNFLQLNTKKTKEVVFDFRKRKCDMNPIIIKNEAVEQVNNYKYLGTIIDDKLNFKDQVYAIRTNVNKRLYFLRKLKSFNVDTTILRLFLSISHSKCFDL